MVGYLRDLAKTSAIQTPLDVTFVSAYYNPYTRPQLTTIHRLRVGQSNLLLKSKKSSFSRAVFQLFQLRQRY